VLSLAKEALANGEPVEMWQRMDAHSQELKKLNGRVTV
jgi:hypothetical protein